MFICHCLLSGNSATKLRKWFYKLRHRVLYRVRHFKLFFLEVLKGMKTETEVAGGEAILREKSGNNSFKVVRDWVC